MVAPGPIDSRARNALILGVLSLVLSVLTGIPAIWYGRQSLRHINAAVRELSGVIDVEVKLKEGTVAVDFDPALAKQELIVGAIQSAGYDVTGTVG